jgi:hypothetical protein
MHHYILIILELIMKHWAVASRRLDGEKFEYFLLSHHVVYLM